MTHKGVIIKQVKTGYMVEDDDFQPLQVFIIFADLVDWLMRYFDEDQKKVKS